MVGSFLNGALLFVCLLLFFRGGESLIRVCTYIHTYILQPYPINQSTRLNTQHTQMALFPDMMKAKCPSWGQKQRCLKEVLLPLTETCEGIEVGQTRHSCYDIFGICVFI